MILQFTDDNLRDELMPLLSGRSLFEINCIIRAINESASIEEFRNWYSEKSQLTAICTVIDPIIERHKGE